MDRKEISPLPVRVIVRRQLGAGTAGIARAPLRAIAAPAPPCALSPRVRIRARCATVPPAREHRTHANDAIYAVLTQYLVSIYADITQDLRSCYAGFTHDLRSCYTGFRIYAVVTQDLRRIYACNTCASCNKNITSKFVQRYTDIYLLYSCRSCINIDIM